MASTSAFPAQVSQEEFDVFPTMDRWLYGVLVMELCREPVEMMQVLALWIWLEQDGFCNTLKKILSLPNILINELADETITCLSCLKCNRFSSPSENVEIPLLQNIMERDISLGYFSEKKLVATQGVTKVLNEVCIKTLTDVMEEAIRRNMTRSLLDSRNTTPSFQQPQAQSVPQTELTLGPVQSYARERPSTQDERILYMTFSKGHPVHKEEIREFLTRNYGDCIEYLYLQEVQPNEQPLYGVIIFRVAFTVDLILGGAAKAKVTINEKHVWVRKNVAKPPKALVPTMQGLLRLPRPSAP